MTTAARRLAPGRQLAAKAGAPAADCDCQCEVFQRPGVYQIGDV
jgi:hypothetical protein